MAQKPRNPTRKNTLVPHPSKPIEHVTDKAVYKKLDDSLVRVATTASSLEAEQDSEMTKTTQALEITSVKKRVKKLENNQRVDSSKDEPSLGEDASKPERKINDIDADEDITLVNDQDDAEMFDVNNLHVEDTAKLIVDATQVSATGEVNAASIATTVSATATITIEEITLAQALMGIKTTKTKEKGIILQKPSESIKTTTISSKKSQDKAKINVDYQTAKRLQAKEQEELSDAEKDTLFMQLLEKRRKFFIAKRAEDKRNKPPTQAQQRNIMCTYPKNVEGKKLKDLKDKSFEFIQKMFDKKFKRVNTFVDFKTELVEGSSKRGGEELIQESIKKQEVEDDKETAEPKQLIKIILDEEEVAIKREGEELIQESTQKQKVEDDKETSYLKQLMKIILDEEEVAIDAISLAVKSSRIAQFRKKQGKNATLQDFDEALDLHFVETTSQSSLTPSMIEGDESQPFVMTSRDLSHLEGDVKFVELFKKYEIEETSEEELDEEDKVVEVEELAFGKHLKEKHVIWAQFGKKQDKNATLQDFDEALDLQCVETVSQSSMMLSMIEGDDVTTICEDVKVADLNKHMEDCAG
nr:hypothetical protein [Tanacetum cinerariifolium]